MDIPKNPYDTCSFVTRFFEFWLVKHIWYRFKHKASEETLIPPPDKEDLKSNYLRVKHAWEQEKLKHRPSFERALWSVYWQEYIFSGLPMLISLGCNLGVSLLIGEIISFLEEGADLYVGILYSLGIFFLALLSQNQNDRVYFNYASLGSRIQFASMLLIYDKLLDISNITLNQESVSASLVSTATTDLSIFEQLTITSYIWTIPFYEIGALVILAIKLGWSGVIGLIFIILNIPLQVYLSKLTAKYRGKIGRESGQRLGLTTNLIEGIRIIKMYAWELPFYEILSRFRNTELSLYWKKAILKVLTFTLLVSGQGFVLLLTFYVHVKLGGTLGLSSVFSAISVLNNSHFYVTGMVSIGMILQGFMKAVCQRVTNTLLLPTKENYVRRDKQNCAVHLLEVNASWSVVEREDMMYTSNGLVTSSADSPSYVLKNVTFHVEPGELCAIVGSVASGKSTVLQTILGETFLVGGDVIVGGSVAYVEQEPWIITGTFRDNIVMGHEYEPEFYENTIQCCALSEDLEKMKYGDKTLVGERGNSLSGGQKARIAIARAVYSSKDIYLLDDPLSAVDSKVADKLFSVCIKGMLREKTRLLVTNQVHFLPQCDKIILLDSGRVVYCGTYEEMQKEEWALEMIGQNSESFKNEGHKLQVQFGEEAKKSTSYNFNAEKDEDKNTVMVEEQANGGVPLKSYYRFVRDGFYYCCFAVLFFIGCICIQFIYIIMQWWISYWTKQNGDEQTSGYYPLILLILSIIVFLTTFFRNSILMKCLYLSCSKLHKSAIVGILFSPVRFFDSTPSGRIINRFSRDLFFVDELAVGNLTDSLMFSLLVLGNIIAMVYIVPINLAALGLFILVAYGIYRASGSHIRDLKRMDLIHRSPIQSSFNATVSGLVNIRCYDWQNHFRNSITEVVRKSQYILSNYVAALRFYLLFIGMTGGAVLGINAILIVLVLGQSDTQLASLSLSFSVSVMAFLPWCFRVLIDTQISMSSTDRLYDYCTLLPEGDLNVKEFEIKTGKIEFQEVTMRYREHLEFSLVSASFIIPGGTRVGVVGRTGSGKSTLFQVLFRSFPLYDGAVFIDDIDISQLGLHDLRKNISIIPQSPFLFSSSLRKNLDPFDQHDDEALWKVLECVDLADYFENSSHGLETELTSNSAALSVGQKQLICLARAILKNNKILVIDEATAFVDLNTDQFIQETIRRMFKGATILTIAHRLHTVIDSDAIIVMDKGRIQEIGKPEDLIKRKGTMFGKMVNSYGASEATRLRKATVKEAPLLSQFSISMRKLESMESKVRNTIKQID